MTIGKREEEKDGKEAATALNQGCFCRTVDHAALERALERDGGPSYADIMETRPHLFSDTRVYVAQEHLRFMAKLARAVERVVALPAWRERVLAHAPGIARHAPKAAGVFLGYDFHLEKDGPRLIEINTTGCLPPGCLMHSATVAQGMRRSGTICSGSNRISSPCSATNGHWRAATSR